MIFLNHLCRGWKIVHPGASHKRTVNGIIVILCRQHSPGMVEYGGVWEPAYTFDAMAPDAEDQEGRVFSNKAERVKKEVWVSVRPGATGLGMLRSLRD
jgi:hypothetical protein